MNSPRSLKNGNHAENGSSGRIRGVSVAVREVGTKKLVRAGTIASRERPKRRRAPVGPNKNHARGKRNRASGQNVVDVDVVGAAASGGRRESEMRAGSERDTKSAGNESDGKNEKNGLMLNLKSRGLAKSLAIGKKPAKAEQVVQ